MRGATKCCCQPCERASGIFDVRHLFNANAVYQLPFGSAKQYLNQPGVWSSIFGLRDVTSTALARTGFSVNVTIDRSPSAVPDGNITDQRPNLVPGFSLTLSGGSTIKGWINQAAFDVPAPYTFGDAPRDVAGGPGTWQMELGLGKHIRVTERLHPEFRTVLFNIFNHPQYGQPQPDLSASPGVFGSMITTVKTIPVGTGTPRQIHFAPKAVF